MKEEVYEVLCPDCAHIQDGNERYCYGKVHCDCQGTGSISVEKAIEKYGEEKAQLLIDFEERWQFSLDGNGFTKDLRKLLKNFGQELPKRVKKERSRKRPT